MKTLWQDLKYGVRVIGKAPGLTIVAVLSVAFGIALNVAVFTLVNGLLLKPMPVRNPDELVALYTTSPSSIYPGAFSYPDYIDYRDHSGVFTHLFIHRTIELSFKVLDGPAEMVAGELVTGNYFIGLQLDPALGRLLLPDDDRVAGAHPVVVLSHSFWQRRFGGDVNVVGQIVRLNGNDFTIVGVAKKGFSGTRQFGWIPDVYLPLMMYAQAIPGTTDRFLTNRGANSFNVNGRLRPGVSIDEARSALSVFAQQLSNDHPQTNANVSAGLIPAGTKTQPAVVLMGYTAMITATLMGLVGLVLLVACGNVANLLLARASARRKEIAIRLALGASRFRLIRQLLTESLMISVAGGMIGLVLSLWLTDLFRLATPNLDYATMDFDYDLSLDYRIFGFTIATSVLTGIIFGLAPALQSSRSELVAGLKNEVAALNTGARRISLRNLMVIGQVALSLMLLISAGLLIKSMRNAQQMDPGFTTHNLVMASVNVDSNGYNQTKGQSFYRTLHERLQRLPGVERASFAGPLPLDQYEQGTTLTIEGRIPASPNERLEVGFSTVAPGYFETMGTRIVQGRSFTELDNEKAPLVAIVNETMALRYWPDQNPIGKRLRRGGPSAPWLEIIGVAENGKYLTLGEPPTDYLFLPYWQNYDGRMTLLLHTAANVENVVAAVREEVRSLDPQLPVYGVRTGPEFVDRVLSGPKAIATTVSGFGLLAVLLAAIGLYGVISYVVVQRTRELGVRIALGARPGDLRRMILRYGLGLALIGILFGTIGALGLAKLMENLLYGVSGTDPMIFAGIPMLLIAVALLACWIPARRATSVDPMVALRDQ
jgi:predicted permease